MKNLTKTMIESILSQYLTNKYGPKSEWPVTFTDEEPIEKLVLDVNNKSMTIYQHKVNPIVLKMTPSQQCEGTIIAVDFT